MADEPRTVRAPQAAHTAPPAADLADRPVLACREGPSRRRSHPARAVSARRRVANVRGGAHARGLARARLGGARARPREI